MAPLNQNPQNGHVLYTDNTNVRRDANTSNKFEKLNTPPLYPWYCPVPEEQALQQPSSSEDCIAALLTAPNQSSYSKVMELLFILYFTYYNTYMVLYYNIWCISVTN